jgi:phage terminase large subunit
MNEVEFTVLEKLNKNIRRDYNALLSENLPSKVGKVPRGYERVGEEIIPIPEILEILVREMYEVRYRRSRSLRASLDTMKPIFDLNAAILPSVQGLSGIFVNLEKKLGISMTKGDFVVTRKKVIDEMEAKGKLPTKSEIKKEYDRQKFEEGRKELEDHRKEEARLKKRVVSHAKRAGVSPENIKKASNNPKKETRVKQVSPTPEVDNYLRALNQSASSEVLNDLYEMAMSEAANSSRKIAFLPTPKQYDFISASEDIVLYGGAAGGGKSYALLFDAVRYAHIKGYRGILIRRTMPELRELIDISRELYPQMFKGCKYHTQEKTWRFASGAILEFGFLDAPADKYQYQGKQYAWIGFDELGLQETSEGFDYLKSRLRTTLSMKGAIRCTANPGSLWVKEMFIDPAPANTAYRDKVGLTYRFIPSLVSDNPYIYQKGEGQYIKMLKSMSEVEKRQLLYGDWTVSDDSAFPEFEIETHVLDGSTFVPKHWTRFCGVDYGYSDQSAAVWGAVNPANGQIVIYKEFAQSGLVGDAFARVILEEEADELVNVDHVVDWSVWNKTGHIGPTIGESMQRAGLRMRRADKNREGGKVQIHSRLRDIDEETPGLVILESCPKLIRELQSLKRHPDKEDIKQTRMNGDHNDLYDALRYGLMSRPRQQTTSQILSLTKQANSWKHINSMFS